MKKSPYRISSRVLRGLSVLIALMFLLFFIVGYDRFYEEDSRFRAPLLTDTLLVFVGVLLLGTLAVTIWSVWVALRRKGAYSVALPGQVSWRVLHGGIAASVVVAAVLAWILGSSDPMMVNGEMYASRFWLRTADMFVALCVLLVVATLVVAGYSSWRSLQKKR